MLTDRIKDLITAFTEMRKQPRLNKKAINKTIGRLEEAELWSKQISVEQAAERVSLDSTEPDVNANPPMQFAGPAASNCICQPDMPPRKDCPVHRK